MNAGLPERLDKLLNAYSHHYDVRRETEVEGGSFPASAEFYLRDENRLLTKEHIYYAVEQHEYVYFFMAEHLDLPTLQKQIELSQRAGLARVRPHKEHMCSYVTLVILADTIDPQAAALLKKTRLRKNYRFTLYGWMEYRIAAVESSTGRFCSNPAGREVRKTLENNFSTPIKKSKKGEIIHEWFGTFGH